MRYFAIKVDEKIGTVIISDDNIKSARARAKKGFGVGPQCVSVHVFPDMQCTTCLMIECICSATTKRMTKVREIMADGMAEARRRAAQDGDS